MKNHKVERRKELTITTIPTRERWIVIQYFRFFWIYSKRIVYMLELEWFKPKKVPTNRESIRSAVHGNWKVLSHKGRDWGENQYATLLSQLKVRLEADPKQLKSDTRLQSLCSQPSIIKVVSSAYWRRSCQVQWSKNKILANSSSTIVALAAALSDPVTSRKR